MLKAISKTKITTTDTFWLTEVTRAWRPFTQWLKATESEIKVIKCMIYELDNECRPAFIDRLRTRFNSIRVRRELEELEKLAGIVINVNFKK